MRLRKDGLEGRNVGILVDLGDGKGDGAAGLREILLGVEEGALLLLTQGEHEKV